MRDTFSSVLVDLAFADEKVLLLTGDHGYALFDDFRKRCPAQYINAGIAEQNMVGMAAGLAKVGYRPMVYGLSAFVPIRVLEQIKLDIAHDNLPVTLFGDGAGFVYSHLGTSHQSTEDIACSRAIPGLDVMSPADRFELKACMSAAYQSANPTYIRMGKADLGDVHNDEVDNASLLGPLLVYSSNQCNPSPYRRKKTTSVTIFATGAMLGTAVDYATKCSSCAEVYSIPVIKPLAEELVRTICSRTDAVVVMEEHSVIGGLSGAILEALAVSGCPPLLRVGVSDRFSENCGSYQYLLNEHKLDSESVRLQVDRFLGKVNSAESTE